MEQLEQREYKEPVKVNIRTFKSSAEIENLYRFISDLKLRKEAKLIFEKILSHISKGTTKTKSTNRGKAKAKKTTNKKSKKVH